MLITARIASIFVSSTVVHIYDFHVFTVIYSPLRGFISFWIGSPNMHDFIGVLGWVLRRQRERMIEFPEGAGAGCQCEILHIPVLSICPKLYFERVGVCGCEDF